MAATAPQRTGVHGEISPLRRVVVHSPGPELERLTPDTREQLLFDEVLWRDRAQLQHGEFTALLRREGVEVLELRDLLTDLLTDTALREDLLGRALDPGVLGDIAVQDLRGALAEHDPQQLVDVLIGGITVGELRALGVAPRSIALQRAGRSTWCSTRCPTICSPGTPPPGSATWSRSARCGIRRATARACTWR